MVKAYLRYEPALAFGVITSTESNITYDPTGAFLLSPALDSLAIWNHRQGIISKLLSLSPHPSPSLAFTSIAASSSGSIATGHADKQGCCIATLNGHRSAVTALRFNKQGSMLASGSKDCDSILWDAVSEAGLFRLQGHRDQVIVPSPAPSSPEKTFSFLLCARFFRFLPVFLGFSGFIITLTENPSEGSYNGVCYGECKE